MTADAEMLSFTVTVETGQQPGQTYDIMTPWECTVKIKVPEGVLPGSKLQVSVPRSVVNAAVQVRQQKLQQQQLQQKIQQQHQRYQQQQQLLHRSHPRQKPPTRPPT